MKKSELKRLIKEIIDKEIPTDQSGDRYVGGRCKCGNGAWTLIGGYCRDHRDCQLDDIDDVVKSLVGWHCSCD